MKHSLQHSRGFSLVELIVAMTIGSFLIIGAVFVYSQSRSSFSLNEAQARLQENARYVLSVVEPEIQLAGYYGFTNTPGDFRFLDPDSGAETYIANLRQDDPAFADVPVDAQACGDNLVTDLFMTVQGADDRYDLAPNGANCAAEGGGAQAGADTLVLRRLSVETAAPDNTRLQAFVSRLSPVNNLIFFDDTPPRPLVAGDDEIRNLVLQAYYISQDSDGFDGLPALRRKSLVAGPDFIDEEIMRGVEDLQVQFGIDVGDDLDGDGTPDDTDADGTVDFVDGNATRYVDPDDPLVASGQVVSVRIWLRVRAVQPEPGYVNDNQYVYGSTDFTADDNIRRVVVSRTILLRNARLFTEVET
jgi:type IV pilus assembly protein PilW